MKTRRGPRTGFLFQVLVVFRKDLAIERATGEVVATSGFFAILVTVLSSLALSNGPEAATVAGPGVIWLAVSFSSVLGLSRSWYREREEAAMTGLVLSPVARGAIYWGKALGILLFTLLIESIVFPVAGLLLGMDLGPHAGPLALIALLADVGLAATGTLFGAMTVRTRARDLLLASVLLPLLAPTLGTAIVATRDVLEGAKLAEITDYLELLGVFDLVFGVAGTALFGRLVEG